MAASELRPLPDGTRRVDMPADAEVFCVPVSDTWAPDYRAALDRAEELLRRCAQVVTMIRESRHDLGGCKGAVDGIDADLCAAGYGASPGLFWTAPARKDSDAR